MRTKVMTNANTIIFNKLLNYPTFNGVFNIVLQS